MGLLETKSIPYRVCTPKTEHFSLELLNFIVFLSVYVCLYMYVSLYMYEGMYVCECLYICVSYSLTQLLRHAVSIYKTTTVCQVTD